MVKKVIEGWKSNNITAEENANRQIDKLFVQPYNQVKRSIPNIPDKRNDVHGINNVDTVTNATDVVGSYRAQRGINTVDSWNRWNEGRKKRMGKKQIGGLIFNINDYQLPKRK